VNGDMGCRRKRYGACGDEEAARDHPFSRHFYMDIEAIPGVGGVDGKEIHFYFFKFFKKVAQKRATFAPFSPYIEAHFYI